jgi:ABC-type enterochelin transport system substrate-binding protein
LTRGASWGFRRSIFVSALSAVTPRSLMFKANEEACRSNLRRRITELAKIFDEPISYFTSATEDEKGYERVV